jgi:hypothetical protein
VYELKFSEKDLIATFNYELDPSIFFSMTRAWFQVTKNLPFDHLPKSCEALKMMIGVDIEQDYLISHQYQFLAFKKFLKIRKDDEAREVEVWFEVPDFNSTSLTEACQEIPSFSHLFF